MARGLMSPLPGKGDSAFVTIGKAAMSNALASAIVTSRIEEMRGPDAQIRNFMRYFTLITKYLTEVWLHKN